MTWATAAALACVLASCGAPPSTSAPDVAGRAPEVVLAACASQGGYVVGDHAVACQGTFAGTLEAQCKSGWAPCTRSPLDASSCAQLPGFFAGSRSASTTCGDAVNVLLGCGTFGSAARACAAGFSRRVPCGGPVVNSPYACSGSTVRNEDPRSGVLCCQGSEP